MRILVVTETVPYPLDSGGRIKTFHTLAALAREHEVHCHAFVRTEAQRAEAQAPLERICRSVTLHLVRRTVAKEAFYAVRSLLTGVPYTVTRHFSRDVLTALRNACRATPFDAVYCDHLSMLEYGRRLPVPIVHDAHNVEYRITQRHASSLGSGPRRWLAEREWRRLHAYESRWYPALPLVFAVSEIDADEIRELSQGTARVVALPIAVPASTIEPPAEVARAPEVLFVGTLDWPPNAEAVRLLLDEIWPRVAAAVPDARLTIVGRGEQAFAARAAALPGVRLTGRVPDVEGWFRRSRVMVVPLQAGSGMRVKILDAMARGVPVVTTPVGVEGIDARPGRDVLVAESADALAAEVIRVLRDDALAAAVSASARALALERYDVRGVGDRLLETLRAFAPTTAS
jgi:glycosyltransferase involved in cell wall biosynthesis